MPKSNNKIHLKTIALLSVFVSMVLFTDSLKGQPIKYAQSGMAFLKIDPNARTAAMAGTQVGADGDVMSMFGNPAMMASHEGLGFASSVTNWIADIKHYSGGIAYNAGNWGTFGASVVWMDYGTFTRTEPVLGTANPELRNQGYTTEGEFTVAEYALGISYARNISEQFSVGGHFRFAGQNLGDIVIFDEFQGENVNVENKVNNYVLDLGTLYYPGFKDLRFGMSFRNFSTQSDYFDQRFELPLTFDFGVAMDVLTLFNSQETGNKLTVAFDWVHPRDYAERQHFGAEYNIQNLVYVRTGFRNNYDERGITGGLGFNLDLSGFNLKADYSYAAFGEFFGSVHRLTIKANLFQ